MPAYPKETIPPLAQVAEDTARALAGEWRVQDKPGTGMFLTDGRRLVHLSPNRSHERLTVQGVDPQLAPAVSAMTHGATVAVHRGPEAIAKTIENRLLPTYDVRLAAAAEREEARAEALRTRDRDIDRLLALVEAGSVRTAYLDARLVSWMIGDTNASAAIYLRREPGTVELTLQRVPIGAVRAIADAVRGVLEARDTAGNHAAAVPTGADALGITPAFEIL